MLADFTAVVVSKDNKEGLINMLQQLQQQTAPPRELIVLMAGYNVEDTAEVIHSTYWFEDPDLQFRWVPTPVRNDWGHHDRSLGLDLATSKWVGFFNDDDIYDHRYIELMIQAGERPLEPAEVVHCLYTHRPDNNAVVHSVLYGGEFGLYSSNAGNFIVQTQLAKGIGYPNTPVYENDGFFINALAHHADRITFLPEVLFKHNEWRPTSAAH